MIKRANEVLSITATTIRIGLAVVLAALPGDLVAAELCPGSYPSKYRSVDMELEEKMTKYGLRIYCDINATCDDGSKVTVLCKGSLEDGCASIDKIESSRDKSGLTGKAYESVVGALRGRGVDEFCNCWAFKNKESYCEALGKYEGHPSQRFLAAQETHSACQMKKLGWYVSEVVDDPFDGIKVRFRLPGSYSPLPNTSSCSDCSDGIASSNAEKSRARTKARIAAPDTPRMAKTKFAAGTAACIGASLAPAALGMATRGGYFGEGAQDAQATLDELDAQCLEDLFSYRCYQSGRSWGQWCTDSFIHVGNAGHCQDIYGQ